MQEIFQQRLITQIALTRFGLKRFENKVNALLDQDYVIEHISIERRLFRTVCYAVLRNLNLEPLKI